MFGRTKLNGIDSLILSFFELLEQSDEYILFSLSALIIIVYIICMNKTTQSQMSLRSRGHSFNLPFRYQHNLTKKSCFQKFVFIYVIVIRFKYMLVHVRVCSS